MQGQSGIESAAKTPRRKPKQADPPPPALKASRSRKKATGVASEPEPASALHPSPDEVSGMIATAAYHFAAERNFEAGHELDDWLRAEQLINGQLSR